MSRLVLGLVVGSALLGGCERFSARSDVAAQVGEHQLTAERVASIMNQSGGGTPTVEAAEFISNLWLDYSLVGRAVAENKIPTDSAAVEALLWPTMATIRLNLLRDSVRAKRFSMTPEALEAAYNEPTYRVFQHIIVIPSGPTARDSAAARQQLTAALARIRGGADFGQIASQLSADGSKNDGGYLPFGPRGQFVPEFEAPAWELAPGAVTDVITTQFGYHLIRRPSFREAQDRFQTGFAQFGLSSVDSTYQAELIAANNLEVTGGAPAAIKSAVADIEGARGSSKVLVKAKSGNVTVGDFAKWGAMFNVQAKMSIRSAPDSLLTAFAKDLGLRTLLLRAADSAGINPEPQMKQFALVRYNQLVTQIESELGLDVPELGFVDACRGCEGQAGQREDRCFLQSAARGPGSDDPVAARAGVLPPRAQAGQGPSARDRPLGRVGHHAIQEGLGRGERSPGPGCDSAGAWWPADRRCGTRRAAAALTT